MSVIVVTTCSDTKRFPVAAEMRARELRAGNLRELLEQWRSRRAKAQPVAEARRVYGGRSFQEADKASQAGHADFYIISAGYGLVSASDQIASYSATLVPASEDFVGRSISSGFSHNDWWSGIQSTGSPTPLADLVRATPAALILFGLSSRYLPMVRSDLNSLPDRDLARVRIAGLGLAKLADDRLRGLMLPYDGRLDGPDSPIRGTRSDFASRALRHFVDSGLAKRGSIREHSNAVLAALSSWRDPVVHARQTKTDDEIMRVIERHWSRIEGKSGRGLRYLRDVENIACEQGRFAGLFRRVAEGMSQ
ncbi:hypothetical protein C7G42_14825 [Bradyrhizobium sp. MOS003]|nr:hypothetical protein C7G42_14825 [Bradyrhizobium sp. MOS003]